MISAFTIAALYLLGLKVFYEYDKEFNTVILPGDGVRNALWYALWPVVIAAAMIMQALDKSEDE